MTMELQKYLHYIQGTTKSLHKAFQRLFNTCGFLVQHFHIKRNFVFTLIFSQDTGGLHHLLPVPNLTKHSGPMPPQSMVLSTYSPQNICGNWWDIPLI